MLPARVTSRLSMRVLGLPREAPLCQQEPGNFILRAGGGAYAGYTARVNLNTKVLGFVQWVNPIPQQPFVLRYSQTSVLKFVQHLYTIRGSMCALLVAGHEWVPCLTEVGGPPTNQSVLFSFSQYGYPTGREIVVEVGSRFPCPP